MYSKPRHPVTAGRRDVDRLQAESPGHFPGIPLWLDKELERELSAPCPLFRTSHVLLEREIKAADQMTLDLLSRMVKAGRGGRRRKSE